MDAPDRGPHCRKALAPRRSSTQKLTAVERPYGCIPGCKARRLKRFGNLCKEWYISELFQRRMMTRTPQKIVAKPRLLFRPDPVLGWALSPDHAVRVQFRDDVIQHIDPDGWRRVPPAQDGPAPAGPQLAVYGCSFTYGTGLRDDETFTARLQQALPGAVIRNRGIGGHGTVQNLLQFRRDIAAGVVDAAVFAVLSDHQTRNIPHPQRMRQYLHPEWYKLGVEHVPVLRRDGTGRGRIAYLPIWQPVIEQGGFDVFLPDARMQAEATFSALDMVRDTAETADVPVQFALLDDYDPEFSAALLDRFAEATDISAPGDAAHTFLPHDRHPNIAANLLFAERLLPVARALLDAAERGGRA